MKEGVFYFSFRSPYSWLAMRQLEINGLGIQSQIEYVPYFEPIEELKTGLNLLGGEVHFQAMNQAKSLYILQDVKRLAKLANLKLKWPIDRSPNWSIPHLVYLACIDKNQQHKVSWRLMEERWLSGQNIFCFDYIQSVLAELFSKQEARDIIAIAKSEQTKNIALDGLYRAYLHDVFGVPFMLCGRNKYWGQDRVQHFINEFKNGESKHGGF